MRDALNIKKSVDILDHIESLVPPDEKAAAEKSIQSIEREAMVRNYILNLTSHLICSEGTDGASAGTSPPDGIPHGARRSQNNLYP